MPLNIIIVGSGIGGPAAGAALARNGHSVAIYERGESTTSVGYAFRITANSDRCLKFLGINSVEGGATQANTARLLDHEGNITMDFGENKDLQQAKKGVSVFASRPQIAGQLVATARSLGVTIKTGVRVRRVDVEKTSITLEDGTEVHGDLIIGADGIHSVVRLSVVDPSSYKAQSPLEQNAFRFMIPRASIQEDEILSNLFTNQFRMVAWKGDQKRILTYPVDFDKHYSVVCTHPASLSDSAVLQPDSNDEASLTALQYNKKVSLQTVHNIYSEFEPRLHRLFDKADPEGFRIWKLMELDVLPTWSQNRTVLIGDAAHATLPFAFSGASMTIEDAIVLSQLLPSDVTIEELPARVRMLQRLREPRIQIVRENGITIGKGEENGEGMGQFMRFLSQYDAVEVGRKALEEALEAQK